VPFVGIQYNQVFLANSTWVCPPGVSSVNVFCLGGGGCGAAITEPGVYGGGGGGGEFANEEGVHVTTGQTYTITVGQGGINGSSPANGGTSQFVGDNLTITAHGGQSVNQNSSNGGAGGTGSTNTAHASGGSGASASGGLAGGGGSSAGSAPVAGNNGTNTAGGAAPSGGGAGGNPGANSPGYSGGQGGGGGGASTTSIIAASGGNGGTGYVELQWILPAVGYLVDRFNEGAVNPLLWTNNYPSQIEVPGLGYDYLVIYTKAGTGAYYSLQSLAYYDITNSQLAIEVMNAGEQSLASLEVYPIYLQSITGQAQLFFLISEGDISAWDAISGTRNNLSGYTPYDPVGMKWLRIRESGGTTYWETAPDGLTWTTFFSMSDPVVGTALQVWIQVGTYNAEAVETAGLFTNVNALPTLTGVSMGTSQVTGTLSVIVTVPVTGRALATSQARGALNVAILRALAGRSQGASEAFARLIAMVQPKGQATATSLARALLTISEILQGQSVGSSQVIGQLSVSSFFAVDSAGTAMVRGRLSITVNLQGQSTGTSRGQASLYTQVNVAGAARAVSLTRATLLSIPNNRLVALSQSTSEARGQLSLSRFLVGRSTGTSEARAIGPVYTGKVVSGRIRGISLVRGELFVSNEPYVGWGAPIAQ
jgi:hypothetical protein